VICPSGRFVAGKIADFGEDDCTPVGGKADCGSSMPQRLRMQTCARRIEAQRQVQASTVRGHRQFPLRD
jgi:hypothetical protein